MIAIGKKDATVKDKVYHLGNVKDWKYLNEGGANVVYSYTGNSNKLNNYVLRLQKKIQKAYSSCDKIMEYMENSVYEKLDTRKYTVLGELVNLDFEFITALDQALDRTKERSCGLDLQAKYGILIPNMNCYPMFAEIKPKKGYLSSDVKGIKQRKCRYCMHQYWKKSIGKVKHVTNYCPIDLYSNDMQKVRKALHALIACPQNNFKVHGESCEIQIVDLISKILEDTQILQDILQLQKDNVMDIEPFYMIRNLMDILVSFQDRDMSLTEALSHEYSKYEHVIRDLLQMLHGDANDYALLTLKEFDIAYKQAEAAFLLSTTLKDCSIMLSIGEERQNDWSQSLIVHEKQYYYVIAIIDLDVKQITNVKKYYEMDQNIVHHFKELFGIHYQPCNAICYPKNLPKPKDVVILHGNMASRLLYPNPVCLLSTYAKHKFNVMTITWLTPINNHGGFVCSIHQQRFTATMLTENAVFVLNVPVRGMESMILEIGSCSGLLVDKLSTLNLQTCAPGWNTYASHAVKKTSVRQRHEKLLKSSFALVDCVAHIVCTVSSMSNHDGHFILTCQQEISFCMSNYFKNNVFAPTTDKLVPYLTFLGSKQFGYIQRN